jgi:alcohol dehydrogenase
VTSMTTTDRWGAVRSRARDIARPFDYRLPTHIVFGDGRIGELPDYVRRHGMTRPLIVTDPGLRSTGIIDRIEHGLGVSGLTPGVFDEVSSDPKTSIVDQVVALVTSEGYDGLVGVGGGSSLDVAKAAAALATNPGSLADYVGRDKIVNQPLPLVAIPTTAGTGSEVTIWSVLTDDQSGAKVSIGSVMMMPDVALLDPELTMGLPPGITAATGMDALSHAVESYGSVWNHAIAEPLALQAIELVGKYLARAVENGTDVEARRGMLLASLVSELAANSTRLGLCHALALPVGARYHVPHGTANAILLDVVCSFNATADPDRYATIAQRLGWGADAAAGIATLRDRIGITERLSHWNVGDFGELADMAMKSDNVQANPREASRDQLMEILRAAM